MVTELRVRHQSQQLYVRALSAAWRAGVQVHEPSLWLTRDPETEEKMLRDIDIAHAISFRRDLIAGRQWQLTPLMENHPRADLATSIGTELLKGIDNFTQSRKNLARAFFSGSRFARIHCVPRTLTIGDGKPRTWCVPTRLEDMDKRMYRIVPKRDEETMKVTATWERWHVGKDDFLPETVHDALHTIRHVYEDDQATLGHGRALREALGWWWYAKTNVFQESLQAVERFAQGIVHAKVEGVRDTTTGLPNTELIQDWQDVLEDLRSRHVLVSDKDDAVEIISPTGEGWQMLREMREELRAAIFTLVLGANLTTSADKGGSYALAEIQENSTEALIQFDREALEETLTKSLLGCLWQRNKINLEELGIADQKPRFSITQEKKQDPQERVTVAQGLHQMGVPLVAEELYEQTGFTKPKPGEDVVEGQQAPDPGLFGGGMPGMPGMPTPTPTPSTLFEQPAPLFE